MSELAGELVDQPAENKSMPRRVIRAIARVLGLEGAEPYENHADQAVWRGNLLVDGEGNVLAYRDSDGVVH